jgi:hypothetical protein
MSADADELQDSWLSTTILCRGVEYFGCRGVDYPQKLTREQVYGVGPMPLGMTPPKVENEEGKITLLNRDFYQMLADFGDGWASVRFDITVQYGLSGSPVHTDVIEGCRLTSNPGSISESTTAIEREVAFMFMSVKNDGKYPVARRRRRG